MLKAYKTQLKTNNKQRTALSRCAGISRKIYNWGLAENKRRYDAGEKIGILKLCVEFNAIKRDQFPYVVDVPYAVTESAFRNLDIAFKNFFRRLKKGGKPGYPKFKNRFSPKSFQLRNVKVFNDYVHLSTLGDYQLCQKGYIPVEADYGVYATISERAGNWHISVLVDDGIPLPEVSAGEAIGVDVGIKSLATFSDGYVVDNPRAYKKGLRKLARLQRELSRRQKDGQNYKKTKVKIARLHARTANIRNAAQHEASNYAVEHGQTIAVESLNIKGMMANHHLAQAVGDSGMGELLRKIQYKAAWNGNQVIQASQWFPSSKLCSHCGVINDDLTLADREWTCKSCGAIIDRDYNAAVNLAALANRHNGRGLPVELGCNNASL